MRLACELRGLAPTRVTGRILTAGAINAHNTAWSEAVKPAPFDDVTIADHTLRLDVPARSVIVLEIA